MWVWKRGFSHVMLLFTNSVFVLCTVLTFDVTVHALEKKKKEKKQNKTKKTQMWIWKCGSKPTQVQNALFTHCSHI